MLWHKNERRVHFDELYAGHELVCTIMQMHGVIINTACSFMIAAAKCCSQMENYRALSTMLQLWRRRHTLKTRS